MRLIVNWDKYKGKKATKAISNANGGWGWERLAI